MTHDGRAIANFVLDFARHSEEAVVLLREVRKGEPYEL